MVIENLLVLYGIGLVLCSLNDSVLCGAIILALVTFQNQISLHQKVINCIEDESELRDIK